MRREGRIPHQRYVMEWVEYLHPATEEVYRTTECRNKVAVLGSNHSKWDRHHDLCRIWKESPRNKAFAKRKGLKNKPTKDTRFGNCNLDEGLSDPTSPESCMARGIAEAMELEDSFLDFIPEDPSEEIFWFEEAYDPSAWSPPGSQLADYGSRSAYEREWPLCPGVGSLQSDAENLFSGLPCPPCSSPRSCDEDEMESTDYGSPPDHVPGLHFPSPAKYLHEPNHGLQKGYQMFDGSFNPGSLIPALKFSESEPYPDSLSNVFCSNNDDQLSDDSEQLLFFGSPSEVHDDLPASPFALPQSAPKTAKIVENESALGDDSAFGEYEKIAEEEWDVVSDEGSWEDEIFDESDICTIRVDYGA